MMEQKNKTALITGANTGLGFEIAKALAFQGLHVILAGRSREKLEIALEKLREEMPEVSLEAGIVDLNSLTSVAAFSGKIHENHDRLDIIVNNAGIMVPPAGVTEDGYESQFGVNFVAHFALTARLFDLLENADHARVVTMSSIAHRGAAIDFKNFCLEKPYDRWREYGASKLADLVFALEFDRRLKAGGHLTQSLAAHPGTSQTELTRNLEDIPSWVKFMSAADGAAPAILASTSPDAEGGQYWGPDGPDESSGHPALATIDPAALQSGLGARLWAWAETATKVTFL